MPVLLHVPLCGAGCRYSAALRLTPALTWTLPTYGPPGGGPPARFGWTRLHWTYCTRPLRHRLAGLPAAAVRLLRMTPPPRPRCNAYGTYEVSYLRACLTDYGLASDNTAQRAWHSLCLRSSDRLRFPTLPSRWTAQRCQPHTLHWTRQRWFVGPYSIRSATLPWFAILTIRLYPKQWDKTTVRFWFGCCGYTARLHHTGPRYHCQPSAVNARLTTDYLVVTPRCRGRGLP